jgi:predicted nuclease of predicted toxin-antitoxin system
VTLKLLADSLFPEGVVEELKQAGYDAVHVGEIGAGDLPVKEIIRLAQFEERILLTNNPAVARLIESERTPKPSVVFFERIKGRVKTVGGVLVNLLTLFDADLAEGAIVVVRHGQTFLRRYVQSVD